MASPQKENGHIEIANEILHALMLTKLNGVQYRLLLVILRKTYGWHKKRDDISLSQFEKLTKLPRKLISRELLRLEKRNIIISNNSPGKTKSYSFQKDYEKWINYLPISRQMIKEVNNNLSTTIPQLVDSLSTKQGIALSTKQGSTIYQSVDELSTKQGNTKEIKDTTTKEKIYILFNHTSNSWENITEEDKKAWQEAYPACNIGLELNKMREWIKGAGTKGHKSQWRKFITNWLSRAQDKVGTSTPSPKKPLPKAKPDCQKCKGTGYVYDEKGVYRGRCSCLE